MKSITRIKAVRVLSLVIAFAALLSCVAFAWQQYDIVGKPSMLLAGMSGYGSLTEESVLGDACADAVRASAGSDFALVMGGEFIANIEPRECTYSYICAALREPEKNLAAAKVSAVQLKEMLEAGLAAIELNENEAIDRAASASDAFPQISGMVVTYDTTARAGERVMRIRVNGKKIDLTDESEQYTIASTEDVFGGAEGYPEISCEKLDFTLAQSLADFIAAGTPDNYTGSGRVVAVGCTDYNIVQRFPLVLCVLVAILIWVGSRLWKYKYTHRAER